MAGICYQATASDDIEDLVGVVMRHLVSELVIAF
jgi:hypothetical protein